MTARRKGRVVVEGRDCDDWMAVDLGEYVHVPTGTHIHDLTNS